MNTPCLLTLMATCVLTGSATGAGKPYEKFNVGPTGIWATIPGSCDQAVVDEVLPDTPASGKLKVNDSIIAVNGKRLQGKIGDYALSPDPRRILGEAIGHAEATDGTLSLSFWIKTKSYGSGRIGKGSHEPFRKILENWFYSFDARSAGWDVRLPDDFNAPFVTAVFDCGQRGLTAAKNTERMIPDPKAMLTIGGTFEEDGLTESFDEVALWDRVITGDEVDVLYNNGFGSTIRQVQ